MKKKECQSVIASLALDDDVLSAGVQQVARRRMSATAADLSSVTVTNRLEKGTQEISCSSVSSLWTYRCARRLQTPQTLPGVVGPHQQVTLFSTPSFSLLLFCFSQNTSLASSTTADGSVQRQLPCLPRLRRLHHQMSIMCRHSQRPQRPIFQSHQLRRLGKRVLTDNLDPHSPLTN